jgi:HD-GYP domain-containing protein (c-di-GMP phosphodiesterase class II)
MRRIEHELRQAEIVMALSLATDLGTGRPMEWAMRSTLLGIRLGKALSLSDAVLREIYYGALLLYIGCTSEIKLALQLFGDDPAQVIASVDFVDQGNPQAMMNWIQDNIGLSLTPEERKTTLENIGGLIAQYKLGHCEVAQDLARRLNLEPEIRHALWHMAEKWNGQGIPQGVQGEAIPISMRVVLLIRDLEPWLYTHGIEVAVTVARQRGGVLHDPHLAQVFCELADNLCANLEQDANWNHLLAIEPSPRIYTDKEYDEALLALGDFVDLISPFFTGHSRQVAELAQAATLAYGLPETDGKFLWRAALVHDLGKVAVPHGLWSRERALTTSEWERVRLHPYYTERILSHPASLAQLGAVAACHHEKLDGSGYHRNIRADNLSLHARLLAVVNAFQARCENRPNREALSPDDAARFLTEQVRAGRMDSEVVNCVLKAAGQRVSPVRYERLAGLTKREIEVLRVLARGFSNRQIAEQMHVSEKTVDTHIMHIYQKIGCSTRSAATLFAMLANLL